MTEDSLTGDEGMSLCESYIMIGSPRPKHSLTQSKDLTEIDPSDQVPSTMFCGAHFLACTAPVNSHESSFPQLICTRTSGMGGLFNQERDVVLWLPEKPRKTPEGWSGNYEPALDSFLRYGGIPLQTLDQIKHVARPIHGAGNSARTGRLLQ